MKDQKHFTVKIEQIYKEDTLLKGADLLLVGKPGAYFYAGVYTERNCLFLIEHKELKKLYRGLKARFEHPNYSDEGYKS